MRWLVDVAYPDAPVIRIVLDNPVSSTGQALNTHRMVSLYETFPAAEARRIVKRLEFHHTPKHASWLNMVEIEFSGLSETACRYATETTWHWLEPSTPIRSGATPLRLPSTGASAAKMPAPNSITSIPAIPKLIQY